MTPITSSVRGPTTALARVLGISRGEVSTVAVVVAIALVLTCGGLAPVLRQRERDADLGRRSLQPARVTPRPNAVESPATAPPVTPLSPATLALPPASPGPSAPSTEAAPPPSTSGGRPSFPAPPRGTVAMFARVPASPYGVAVDGDGTVFASTSSSIVSFGPDGSPAGELAVRGTSALALAAEGALVAADPAGGRVLRIDPDDGAQSVVATLVDLPACALVVAAQSGCEPGVDDGDPSPRGLAYDGDGTLYVTDATQGTIWRIERSGDPEPWLSANQWARGANALAGIAVDAQGSLLVASPEPLDAAAPAGGVYRVEVNGNGSAGDVTLVAAVDGEPTGIAVLPDGSFVVSLARAIVHLDADGAEMARVAVDGLHRPSGLAFLGRTLLAANTGARASEWSLLAVGIR